jgi:inosine/xanthosine triphosphatase
MKVLIGSKNPVKIEAVRRAFTSVFPDQTWECIGISCESGVSAQPMTEAESIRGARNRAAAALATDETATYAVGLEGGLQEIEGMWFVCGWIVVINQEGREGVGATIQLSLPATMMDMILAGKELGEVTDSVFKKENTKHGEGFFGEMTGGVISRARGYGDGVVAALATFVHPNLR